MRHNGLRVRIIGAGTGGLCLAQGLRRDDVDAELFERNTKPTDRQQGYERRNEEQRRKAVTTWESEK